MSEIVVSHLSILRLLAFLTNRRNQNAPPVERISSTTAFAPLNNGSTVVIMSRKKAAASVAPSLLDHDRTGHLRVNGAEVGIGARSARSDSEFLVGVEGRGFLKLLLNADDRVRFVVAINPGDLFARLHG